MKIRHALTGIAAGALLFVGAGAADAAAQTGAAAQAVASTQVQSASGGTFNGNTYFFFNSSGLCLDADTGTLHAKSTKVQLWACNGLTQQHWVFHQVAGEKGVFTITNVGADGKCLDADSGTIGHDGTIVHLYPCDGWREQQWIVYESDNGTLYLLNIAGGRYLDAASEHAGQNGDPVQLWDWNHAGASQSWRTT